MVHNVAIVGLGHVARHQVSAIEQLPNFRLVAGCDADSARLAFLEHSAETFTDLDAMLAIDDIDVVVVASPNRLHVAHGIRVMEAGKWLLMEKPLAETQAEFDLFASRRDELGGRCSLALHAAFGVELEWFCRRLAEGEFGGSQPLTSFEGRFYDPYLSKGKVKPNAHSLGGAWIDSGINALSVVCRLIEPESLEISDSRMTRVADSSCKEVQGTVEFRFHFNGSHGSGSIDTNWTIGRDHKSTLIGFADDNCRYLLDHSKQQVARHRDRHADILYSSTNGLPRLTNHYIGVFNDLANQVDSGSDNFDFGGKLHGLVYEAEDWSG